MNATAAARRRPTWPADAVAAVILMLLAVRYAAMGPSWAPLLQEAAILPFAVAMLVAGWVIARRRPHLTLGWIMLAIPGLFALMGVAGVVGAAVESSAPGVAGWLYVFGSPPDATGLSGNWMLPIGLLFTQLPLRFPTGRPPSPRWNAVAWYSVISLPVGALLVTSMVREFSPGIPNPIFVEWAGFADAVPAAALVLGLAVPALLSIASLFARYRVGSVVERAQLRWIFWATATAMGVLLLGWVLVALGGDEAPGWVGVASRVGSLITVVTYALIPLSILFAVLRLDLYAIDRVISRTVAYAALTLILVGGYVAVVVTLSTFIPRLPAVGVAVATLAAAGAFLPLLRWIRRLVDRRFDRAAYDAQKVVDAFGERLRNGADPHATPADLTAAVERTLQPTAVGVWTRRST